MTPTKINKIFHYFEKHNPNPTTELHYNSAFELLIAVILSAQATDVSVNKATAQFFPIANTPETILALGEKKFAQFIKSIGLYNTKAKNILLTCDRLIKNFNSEVPNTRSALESLPGVGRKTANVVLNTFFDEPTIAVDTHIFRVANRIGLANGKTPRQVEDDLLNGIPKKFLKDAHHWLILHGRYTCSARKPNCPTCPIKTLCDYSEKTPN